MVELPDGRTYNSETLLSQAAQTYQNTRRTYNLRRINACNGLPRQVSSGKPNKSKYTRADAAWAYNQNIDAIAVKFGLTKPQAYGVRHYLKRMYGNGSLDTMIIATTK